MSNKRKIKRSWGEAGDSKWRKGGDEVTQKIESVLDTDVQQIMVNSQELIMAFKTNLSMMGGMAAFVDDSNEDRLRAFMCQYNGAIVGMVNLLGVLGVYSSDKCHEIIEMFLNPEEIDG